MAEYTKAQLTEMIVGKLRRNFGRDVDDATPNHMFKACALVLRDIMSSHQMETGNQVWEGQQRQVHYLSLEFLMGRSLEKNAYNLGLLDTLKDALEDLGFSASDLFEKEPDAGLGNGGLGRLAACYLDSMTTLEIPAPATPSAMSWVSSSRRSWTVSRWSRLTTGWAWATPGSSPKWMRPRRSASAARWWTTGTSGGSTIRSMWATPLSSLDRVLEIAGYKTRHTNTLRLWDAKSPVPVDMSYYSRGEYLKAVEQQAMAEVIAKVLYPDDNHYEGKSLRLKQQYFFVSATVQSIVRQHRAQYGTLRNFHEKHVIQINDTHPTLVIPELMRILLDVEGYSWNDAWNIVTHTVAYTNHTVLAEALERWPQGLIENLLPRIWQILKEIAARYQRTLEQHFHGDQSKVSKMAIIWNGEVRMANLCVCACYAVNGVSALHSEILKQDVFHDAYTMRPEQFKNVTNGVDHRRWLSQINPKLDALVKECTGGDDYLLHPEAIRGLEKYKDDQSVLSQLEAIKKENKRRFAAYVARESGVVLNTDAVFDVQVKRLHEYKRQLLNVLHIIHLYNQLRDNPNMEFTPQTFLFGAKAAPGYHVAKKIIQLINSLSAQINADPICKDKLQVVFLENYRVSLAEKLMPASEISEQISTAGKEASGTGNMKFMMNGALTIGTLDGANVEMHQQLGDENIFLFGLTADQVVQLKNQGYIPANYYNSNPAIKRVLDQIRAGFGDGVDYNDIADRLLIGAGGSPADEYLLLADFDSYCQAHRRAIETYADRKLWNQMSLINIARSGIFAADRSIRDYASDIWHVPTRL